VAILALHYAGVGPAWPAWAEHLYEALEVLAAGCCLWRAVAHPKERKPWLVIGLGMVSFAAADLYYTIALQPLGDDNQPRLPDERHPAARPGGRPPRRVRAPRLARVFATEPGLLYALERESFVSSVTNNPRSVIAADDVIEARLAPV
jgi:hypothetical protein